MIAAPAVWQEETWLDANHRYLAERVSAIRRMIERHVSGLASGPEGGQVTEPPEESPVQSLPRLPDGSTMEPPPALEIAARAFDLSSFERDLLVMCAGFELDGSFAEMLTATQPDAAYASFGLALAALPGAHWSALSPARAIRRWRLVEPVARESLTTARLRIDERVLHYLTGVDHPDERIAAMVTPLSPQADVVRSHTDVRDRILRIWARAAPDGALPVVLLAGSRGRDALAIAGAACASAGLVPYVAPALLLPADPIELDAFTRLFEREAALSRAALLLECGEADFEDAVRSTLISRLLDSMAAPVIVVGVLPGRSVRRPVFTIDVPTASRAEQRILWERAVGPGGADLNGALDGLVSQFTLGGDGIRSAALEALGGRGEGSGRGLGPALWDAARAQARPALEDLAQRIEPAARWDDLVLPSAQLETLRLIATHVRERSTVYDRWGFASKGSRGLGIGALFAGPSGTGKTMAAEVLADELRLDLYRIDLSSVVSKYIGETEKNLRRVFDAAEAGAAILLFDEADALFGKRTEVRDSHDRYANIEVSYLLQRMEAYRGLAILTTNMKGSLDAAFLRRIRFVVQFPFPDAEQRAEIWRRVFPREAPVDGIDAERLARLIVAGGSIRNIAMGAAFLAAGERAPVRMDHIVRASRAEYAKLEKPLTEAEIGGLGG
jgi:hypothetical protein